MHSRLGRIISDLSPMLNDLNDHGVACGFGSGKTFQVKAEGDKWVEAVESADAGDNIGQSLLNIYRGGTDESTFGPHVDIRDSHFNEVGNPKRKRAGASVFMLGVQVATITNNEFINSRAIKMVQTVGEPVTSIIDNQFIDTAPPEIINGVAKLSGNTVSGTAKP